MEGSGRGLISGGVRQFRIWYSMIPLKVQTEQDGSSNNASDLHFGRLRSEFRPEHRLSRLRIFIVFFGHFLHILPLAAGLYRLSYCRRR
jgi:hypothetical protein